MKIKVLSPIAHVVISQGNPGIEVEGPNQKINNLVRTSLAADLISVSAPPIQNYANINGTIHLSTRDGKSYTFPESDLPTVTITSPAEVDAVLKTATGCVITSNIDLGVVETKASTGGEMHLQNTKQATLNAGTGGEITAKSVSGNLDVDLGTGGTAKVASVRGDVYVKIGTSGTLKIGGVQSNSLRAKIGTGGSLHIRSGSIDATVVKAGTGADADIMATTKTGDYKAGTGADITALRPTENVIRAKEGTGGSVSFE